MSAPGSPPVLLWDGDCGFCAFTVGILVEAAQDRFEAFPYQTQDLDSFGVTEEECRDAAQWVTQEFRASGAEAIAHAMRLGPLPCRIVGFALLLPPVRPLARLVYGGIARSRGRISGRLGLDACEFPDGSNSPTPQQAP